MLQPVYNPVGGQLILGLAILTPCYLEHSPKLLLMQIRCCSCEDIVLYSEVGRMLAVCMYVDHATHLTAAERGQL